MKAYRWQNEAFHKLKDLTASMIHAACGLGKTFVGIKIALYKRLPVLVIAPKSLCWQWHDDLVKQGVEENDIFVYDQPWHTRQGRHYEEEMFRWLQQ